MKTVNKKSLLKSRAIREVKQMFELWDSNTIPLIADIGANIGYYTEAFSKIFDGSIIHSYEPHPYNIKHLMNLDGMNVSVHPYGLFDEDITIKIGLPVGRTDNNGLFSIHYTEDSVEVELKDAVSELIRPDIVKIDVEGSESYILNRTDFFENTKMILIEIVKDDNFGSNIDIVSKLNDMGFTYMKNTSKNNQLWLR